MVCFKDLDEVAQDGCCRWAKESESHEWEEEWDEYFRIDGKVDKSAEKWAREGSSVWHEKWGEAFDGQGTCTKWTDRVIAL